eukprot:3172925-Lingulodinium_polyedra.AAC.1
MNGAHLGLIALCRSLLRSQAALGGAAAPGAVRLLCARQTRVAVKPSARAAAAVSDPLLAA